MASTVAAAVAPSPFWACAGCVGCVAVKVDPLRDSSDVSNVGLGVRARVAMSLDCAAASTQAPNTGRPYTGGAKQISTTLGTE